MCILIKGNGKGGFMEKQINLKEAWITTGELLKAERQDSLSKVILRGKTCKRIREEMNCYKDFKEWCSITGYSISTLNRDINRYGLYELMETDKGRKTAKELPAAILAGIGKLKNQNKEKHQELISLIDMGLDNHGIKGFLEENIKEENTSLKGEDIKKYILDMEKEVKRIDIRELRGKTGKKIAKAVKKVLLLISECTKLAINKRNKDLSRKIKELNYGMGVLSIS